MKQKNILFAFMHSLNYFYITIILLWQVIQNYIGVDGKGRIPFLVTIIYLIYSLVRKSNIMFSMPLRIWWVWVVYALVNTFFIQGSPMKSDIIMSFFTKTIAGPLLVCAIIEEYLKNKVLCLKYVGSVLLTYIVCAIMVPYESTVFDSHGISGFGNIVPITCVFLAFVSSMRFISKGISKKTYFLLIGFALGAIIVSATRKAFGGIIIVMVFTYFAYLEKRSFRSIVNMLVAGLIVYIASESLKTTQLWERFTDGLDASRVGEYSDNRFLSAMGDRAFMYVEGWNLFLDHKWLGIGLRNFVNMEYSRLTLHSEYMVQLSECGIVGSSLFLLFYGNIIRRLFQAYKLLPSMTLVHFGGLAVILFMSFTAWTYDQPVFFAGLGIIISFIVSVKKHHSI